MTIMISSLPHLAGGKPATGGDFLLDRRLRVCRPWLSAERGTLLDFGCGNGAQTLFFASEYAQTCGIDVNRKFLDNFRYTLADLPAKPSVRILQYDGARIPLADNSVDQVISFTVLEHVRDEAAALREIRRVLTPGGRLLLSVPNKWWIFETHGCDLPLLPWNRVPLVSWWPQALHDRFARARIYRRGQIVDLVSRNGFDVRASMRLTAPLDMLKYRPLRNLCRRTLFSSDITGIPFLATEILLAADKAG